jgi:hypothetical protein
VTARVIFEFEWPWAYLTLEIDGRSVRVGGFGDNTDGLGDLVRAAVGIAARSYREEVRFDGEPAEWRLIMQRDWNSPRAERLKVELLSFPDFIRCAPGSEGVPLLVATCDADEFASAVAEAASQVWEAYGEDGYNELTRIEGFPLRGLRALQMALLTNEAKAAVRHG